MARPAVDDDVIGAARPLVTKPHHEARPPDAIQRIRLKLIVAYDGRPFRGWQSQAGGGAIQNHLEIAFAKLCGHRVVVHGAGRTDAGVHALAQVAHVEVPAQRLTNERWQFALNARLPPEIRVMRVTRPRAFVSQRPSGCV